ncbi:hypothetical protein [Actinomadura miaoliensis]
MSERGVAFRCAECGEVAATVRLQPREGPVNMGPPLGYQRQPRDGAVLDGFLGTVWHAIERLTYDEMAWFVAQERPDAAWLRAKDWQLAPFYCRHCELNYCRADWHPQVRFDEGFYDCTVGHCPRGHQQTIDD